MTSSCCYYQQLMKRALPILVMLFFAIRLTAYPIVQRRGAAPMDATHPPLSTLYTKNNDLNQQQMDGLESSMIGFEAITKSDRAWIKKYNLLVAYYTKYHHTIIPVADATLGRWVQRQRSYYKQGTLAQSRIKALNEVKFMFDARNQSSEKVPKVKKWGKLSWEERYTELTLFFNEHGHCNVPLKSGSLGGWVQYQRRCNDKGKLSIYQIDKLNAIDFIWNVQNYQWDQRFTELKEFIERHNGCSYVPSTLEYKSLQAWCGTQRKLRRMNALTDEREQRLNSISFDWHTSHDYMWQLRLRQLQAYKEENGHVLVNRSDGELGTWAKTQRTEMRFKINGHHTHLTDERIDELESVGFAWSIREAAWEENYSSVLQCHREKTEVPQKLATWLRDQKRFARAFKMGDETALSPKRAAKLSRILEIEEEI